MDFWTLVLAIIVGLILVAPVSSILYIGLIITINLFFGLIRYVFSNQDQRSRKKHIFISRNCIVDTSITYIYNMAADQASGRWTPEVYQKMRKSGLPDRFPVYLTIRSLQSSLMRQYFVPKMDIDAYQKNKKLIPSVWNASPLFLRRK